MRAAFTDRRDGDLGIDAPAQALTAARAGVAPGPWTWLRQVHGCEVVVADRPGAHAGAHADAAVTAVPGVVVAVQTADCAPLLLRARGAVGVVHVGWRGLVAGVVEATAATMSELGSPPTEATLGPCIRPRCYEFGEHDVEVVADRYGPSVRSHTAWHASALDLAAGVAAACAGVGVPLIDAGTCTACSPNHFSHRARGDRGRQALVAWIER